MPKVKIITDSTSDLGAELISRYNVTVVPLSVLFDQKVYHDGIDIDTPRLFAIVDQQRRLPKTSCPNPSSFQSVFAEATHDGSEALYIGISSKFSAAVQNATIAADLFPDGQVRVFDSANLSTGIGLQVLHACDLAAEGKRVDEIVSALEASRPKVRTQFVIETLDYMRMGGRCSGVTALATSLLQIRPIISVVNGGMEVSAKVQGPRKRALNWMLKKFTSDLDTVVPNRVFVTHTDVHDDAMYLAGGIRRAAPHIEEILETHAGSVIASHCGPGTIGVLYTTR